MIATPNILLSTVEPLFSDKQIITMLSLICFLLFSLLLHLIRIRSGLEDKTRALKKSDLHLKIMNDNLPKSFLFQLIYSLQSEEFRFGFISNRYETVYDLDRNVLLENSAVAFEQVYPEDRSKLKQAFVDAKEQLEPTNLELRIRDPKGAPRWIQICAVPQLCDHALVWEGFIQDVSAAKKIEMLINDENHNFKQLFDHMQNFLFVCSSGGDLIHTNYAVEKRLGYPADELGKMNLTDLYPIAIQKEIAQVIQQQNKDSSSQINQPMLLKNGSEIFIEMRLTSGTWNQQPALFGVAWDVAHHQQTKVALRESRRILQLIIDNIPMPVFWKDKDSIFLGCNTAFIQECKLLTHHDVVGKSPFDLFDSPTAEQIIKRDQEVISSNLASMFKLKPYVLPDGVTGWREISTVPLQNSEGSVLGVLGIWNDITERKKAEEQLQKTMSELERFNELMRKREIRTLELKSEINQMRIKLNKSPKYKTTSESLKNALPPENLDPTKEDDS